MSEASRRVFHAAWVVLALLASPVQAGGDSVFLEELTSTELRARIDRGATTVLLPIGGTEQNGAHLVLGKHNQRSRLLAGRIALRLGDAVVAPVIAYVPDGAIDPPRQHMRWSGTISVPEPAFEATLEAAARSFRQHGFRQVVLLGDHGGYQRSMERAADRVNREAEAQRSFRVIALREYYLAATTDFAAMLRAGGFGNAEIGQHAGLADTALALAADASLVRTHELAARPGSGVSGDPRRANAALGRRGLDHIVEASASAIRRMPALNSANQRR
jgi:creatinine amidohydrolase/Fe(II)-dependent formamide hydrolase-like protein